MNYEKRYLSFADNLTENITESARQGKTTGGLGSRPRAEMPKLEYNEDTQAKYMSLVRSFFPPEVKVKTKANPEVGLEELYVLDQKGKPQKRPQAREDIVPEVLKSDPEFEKQINRLVEKYGFSKSEIYKIIQGESSFNPRAQNKSGATGLFQLMPESAAEIGWTTEEIKDMEPAEQVKVYEQYLDRWGYSGNNSLAIMQAAPAFADASSDTVVYKKGSAAWKQNPGWRPANGGDITVGSINEYYRKQGL